MRSPPETIMTGPSESSRSMPSTLTHESPRLFGLKGERVAKTPIRSFPPSLGGLTVGWNVPSSFFERENSHMSHILENPSKPLRASGLRYEGEKTILPSSPRAIPLWRGSPNLPPTGQWYVAMGEISMGTFLVLFLLQRK